MNEKHVEHYFVVKWTKRDGFVVDDETLMIWSDDNPLYDPDAEEHGWFAAKPNSKIEKKDLELSEILRSALAKIARKKPTTGTHVKWVRGKKGGKR